VAGDKFDHVVSVMFENRSFDNLLGRLYELGKVASFEGVLGKDLSNPIPSYAPDAERGVVPIHVATSLDAPNPDAGEKHPHTNTQLYGEVAPEGNGFISYEQMQPPFNAPDLARQAAATAGVGWRRAMTLSMIPYSVASSGLMKKSRSMSCETVSIVLPVCSA
jgi:hypothetical protein